MRLLHTSDWHLGDHLGTIDRTDDQFRVLDHLLGYCAEHRVDVLAVAGDVINEYHGEKLARLVRGLGARLEPLLANGMRAVFVAGNHDREHFFRILETVQALSNKEEVRRRIHFVGRPRIMGIPDVARDEVVQFVLAPYPFAGRYLPDDAGVRGMGLDERRQAIARSYAARLAAAYNEIAPGRRTVLVSHVYVRTGQTSSLFRMTEAEDIPIEPQDLPNWDYEALGHLHRPQVVGERTNVRYSGSIDRLDVGERNDEKSCVLVEIGPEGLAGEPALLPLPATPIYTVEVQGGDDINALSERYPDHDVAMVNLHVHYRPGEDNPATMMSELGRLFPRCFDRRIRSTAEPPVAARLDTDLHDRASTMHAFLEQQLANHPRRERLISLASELVQEVEHAAAAH